MTNEEMKTVVLTAQNDAKRAVQMAAGTAKMLRELVDALERDDKESVRALSKKMKALGI
jgi:Na+/phosphate symporter